MHGLEGRCLGSATCWEDYPRQIHHAVISPRWPYRGPWLCILLDPLDVRLFVGSAISHQYGQRIRLRYGLDTAINHGYLDARPGETPAQKSPTLSVKIKPGIDLATTYSHRAYRPTTIGATAFHFRVRNGTGWFHHAMVTRILRNLGFWVWSDQCEVISADSSNAVHSSDFWWLKRCA